jgi:hypothetical protein
MKSGNHEGTLFAELRGRRPEMVERNQKANTARSSVVRNEEGAIGYIAAWLLGVPASLLFVIFLMRGCN